MGRYEAPSVEFNRNGRLCIVAHQQPVTSSFSFIGVAVESFGDFKMDADKKMCHREENVEQQKERGQ